MKTKLLSLCLIILLLGPLGCATLSETSDRYRSAVGAIENNQPYFAVVYLKSFLKDDPQSIYAPAATFALGEYYFDNSDYFNALTTLSDFIHRYPKDKGAVFAKLIIYKIITGFKKEEDAGDQESELIKEIRKELFSQPLFLIFYDKKLPRPYKSLFKNSYLVYDYVDKMKVFRNDKIFLELSP